MQVIQDKLAMYLTSEAIDPKTVSGKLEAATFNSGIERLLAQIQRFEASKDDLMIFKDVEHKLFDLVKKYNNLLVAQNVPGYISIPEDAEINLSFNKPEKLETQSELEERWINLRNEGLATTRRAIMEVYGISKEKAEELEQEIASESFLIETDESDDDAKNDDESR